MVRAPYQYPVPASLACAVIVIGFCLSVVIGVGLLFTGLCVLPTLCSLASSLVVSDVAVVVADFAHILKEVAGGLFVE